MDRKEALVVMPYKKFIELIKNDKMPLSKEKELTILRSLEDREEDI